MDSNSNNKPEVWTTFRNKEIPVSELSHQHLSNIYYWSMLYYKEKPKWVLQELDERFNGQLLDYRPHVSFKEEINFLHREGMIGNLTEIDGLEISPIIFRGVNIGQIRVGNVTINEIIS